MIGTEKIKVSMSLEGQNIDVGELVFSNRKIYFKYTPGFLDKGLNISPVRLPYTSNVVSTEYEPFEGLFGVFNDSLPDGWGRLLLDRTLTSKGINIGGITPLDRLAFVGSGGMGALVYQPEIGTGRMALSRPELDTIAREINQVLEGAGPEIIEKLFILGGSSSGARPKIFVGFDSQTGKLVHGADSLPEGYAHWIIKFPSSSDNREIANIEFAYHKMALLAGIEMSECKLFRGESGRVYFGTKRFDRIGNNRLHMHTASGIMHDNFRMSTMDYGHLMDCAYRLEKHVHAYEKIFRLAAFNVYAHNRDDHSKNFSFLMNAKGEWYLAPAYDLTFSHSAYGFHSTMVAGESKNPGRKELMNLATHFGIKNAKTIISQVQEAISSWDGIAKETGVSNENRQSIKNILGKLRD